MTHSSNHAIQSSQIAASASLVETSLPLKAVSTELKEPNELKRLFHNNQAILYALNIRTFGAPEENGDRRINPDPGENGTFLSAIPKLDELVDLGINTIHLLPINPIGLTKRLGEAGSLYAPSDYHSINPEFGTVEDAQTFVQAAHQKGLNVMVDVPSCASIDLAEKHPSLIMRDEDGKPHVPTDWIDIVMFKNGPEVTDYFAVFFDLMANKVGVDGFRCDVARARTQDFWKHFTSKYSDKAWLAESYCEEGKSPLKNIPRDTPEKLLATGFDAIYGQWHIFPSMANAAEYHDYLLSSHEMFQRVSKLKDQTPKSFIGSFLTHDDPSLMSKGGTLIYFLASGLMTTQPYTNPYILDGFTTGFMGDFDIFRFRLRPVGDHPEIGVFLKQMLALRKQYEPLFSHGSFMPITTVDEPESQLIAFVRQTPVTLHKEEILTEEKASAIKTLLVIANKDVQTEAYACLDIPGLSQDQPLQNLAPAYGSESWLKARDNQLEVKLAPGRFYVLEINTPYLSKDLPTY
jgi:glycosidase